jgi:hypothetical protein
MAYPTVDKPYGLKPVNLIGGQVFAGATRQMQIATTANVGYGTSIFYGDLVTRVTGGTIEKDTGTTTAEPCGVFLGCTFTNSSTGQVQFQQFYPASTSVAAGTKIFAYVADDPDTLFQLLLYLVQPLSLVSVLPPLEVMQRWCKTRVAPRQVTLP